MVYQHADVFILWYWFFFRDICFLRLGFEWEVVKSISSSVGSITICIKILMSVDLQGDAKLENFVLIASKEKQIYLIILFIMVIITAMLITLSTLYTIKFVIIWWHRRTLILWMERLDNSATMFWWQWHINILILKYSHLEYTTHQHKYT